MTSSLQMKRDTLCKTIFNKSPDNEKYADQRHVFEQVGLEILANAW